jgi:hypothetical protein
VAGDPWLRNLGLQRAHPPDRRRLVGNGPKKHSAKFTFRQPLRVALAKGNQHARGSGGPAVAAADRIAVQAPKRHEARGCARPDEFQHRRRIVAARDESEAVAVVRAFFQPLAGVQSGGREANARARPEGGRGVPAVGMAGPGRRPR